MTKYISSYDPAAHRETIYTIDDQTGAANVLGEYVTPISLTQAGSLNIFSPGLDGIALSYPLDKLFVLGDYERTGNPYGYINTFPILTFTPSSAVSDFSNINKRSSAPDSIFSQPTSTFYGGSPYTLGEEGYLYDVSTAKNTTKNILTFGDGNLYAFFPGVKEKKFDNSIIRTIYSNDLVKINPSNINSTPTTISHFDFAINALAYDPTLDNNPEIKHRLFATAAGSNGDQLYSIDLDKIGQADGIKKIGDVGIGSADVNGLIFDKGVLHGFTKTGQQLVIDLISGQGSAINKPLIIQGQVTGAAASQDKFNIEDKGYLVNRDIPSFLSKSQEIHLNLIKGSPSSTNKWNGGQVWILSHGFNSSPETFNDIFKAIQAKHSGDDIITVDWSNAANILNSETPGTAAKWIKEVADYTSNQLKDWGLKATDGSKINLIGHSLGTFVSSELAANFGKVNSLIALEPASSLDGGSYDLDGLKSGSQNPREFNSVANFSRAFEGTQSLASSTDLASTANESILMDFGRDLPSPFTEHSEVIKAFASLVDQDFLDAPSLSNKLFSLDNLKINDKFQRKTFTSYRKTEFDGKISIDTKFQPTSFEAVLSGTTNNHVIYSTNKDSSLSIPGIRDIEGSYELFGGNGNDILSINSSGTAKLTGGAGNNLFVFGGNVLTRSKAIPFGGVEIKDFKNGKDKIVLNQTPFGGLKAGADGYLDEQDFAVVESAESTEPQLLLGSRTAKVLFDVSNSGLYYNPYRVAGSLSGGKAFARLVGVGSISASDIKLTSGGGLGAKVLTGSPGNDTYAVDNSLDTIIEAANEGIDTVQASVTYALGDNVENLTLTGTEMIDGTGNSLDNIIIGNSNNNILNGGDGNDTLDGGLGADTMSGGNGNDIYVVDNVLDTVIESANTSIAIAQPLPLIAAAFTLSVEAPILADTAKIDSTGNALNTLIAASESIPIVQAPIASALAVKVETTSNALTAVTASAQGGIDTVQSSITYTLGANVENLTLTGTAKIDGMGNTLDNIIIGNSGNNILTGGGGLDILTGGAGNDIFDFSGYYAIKANTTNNLSNSYATITDFNPLEDIVRLKGSVSNYRLQVSGDNTNLYLDRAGLEPTELIGVFRNVAGLNLTSSAFEYISPIPQIAFSSENYAVSENGTVQVALTRTGITTSDLTVNYTIVGIATNCTDYQNLTGTVTFKAGESKVNIDISPIDDNIYEGNEAITLSLNDGGIIYKLDPIKSSTVTITDNDTKPTISVANSTQPEGNSGDTNYGFNLTLGNPSVETITVKYATADDTATAGSDYTATTGTVTFAPGETTQAVNVAVTGDDLYEADESFKLNLSEAVNVTIATSSAIGKIVNDDLPVIALVTDADAAEPANPGQFTLTRTGITTSDLTVNYTLTGTAINGMDYQALSNTVTFKAGSNTATVDITTIDDHIYEGNETVTLTLTDNAAAYKLAAVKAGTVTIADDDTKPVIWISDAYPKLGKEGDPDAAHREFDIYLSHASTETITVEYATADGTAFGGSDFESTAPTTLTFAPGETCKTVSVKVIDDKIHEDKESFIVELTNATNATIGIGYDYGVAKIIDDDLPGISIDATDDAAYETNKGQPNPGKFTFKRTGSTTDALDVKYTIEGSATNGTDYTKVGDTITFAAGSDTTTIEINPIDDLIFEGTETVTFNLSDSNNYTIVGDKSEAVKITDLVLPVKNISEFVTGLQGKSEGEVIDLRGFAGQTLKVDTVSVGDAAYQNYIGFYAVEDAQGTLANGLKVGDAGYAEAAIKSAILRSFKIETQSDLTVSGGKIFAPVVIANGTFEDFLNRNPQNQANSNIHAYFNYIGANTDKVDHFRLLGANKFGVEDLYGGGDRDYNDIVIQMNVKS
jgi:pimeloyl-ACP methyl ester carboxylesterase